MTWLEALLFNRREHAMERDRVPAKPKAPSSRESVVLSSHASRRLLILSLLLTTAFKFVETLSF